MNARERRRERRAERLGPLKELVESFVRDGEQLERLSCGHEVPAGPPRQTQTPGKIMRHCIRCPRDHLDVV